MAFSKNPEFNTYSSKKIKLLRELDSRSSSISKDVNYLNCFFEVTKNKTTQEQDYNIVKRPGLSSYANTLPSTNIRGIYYWEDKDKIIAISGNDVWIATASTGTHITTLSGSLATLNGKCGFTEFLYDDNTSKVIISDGTKIYTLDNANTLVAVTDVDFPTPHVAMPVFLDGYLFLAKADTADIYNSDLNNPLAWTAGNFISAEMFPDNVTAVAKLNNYLVAFGSSSIEYFWDAANASGSPLQRNDTPVKLTGYLGGLCQVGNTIYFLGNSSTGTPDVYVLEDFKMESVSDTSVRKYLEDVGSDLANSSAVSISFLGHDFYMFTIGATTYVYDTSTKLWTTFAYQANLNMYALYATSVKIGGVHCSVIYINNATNLARFDVDIYQDVSTNFTMRIVTGLEQFDSYNQKVMHRLIIDADKPTANAEVDVSWSDDDYQTFNTAVGVNLNQELPSITRLGRFRRRAFKLEFVENFPLRMRGLEVDINMGQT